MKIIIVSICKMLMGGVLTPIPYIPSKYATVLQLAHLIFKIFYNSIYTCIGK